MSNGCLIEGKTQLLIQHLLLNDWTVPKNQLIVVNLRINFEKFYTIFYLVVYDIIYWDPSLIGNWFWFCGFCFTVFLVCFFARFDFPFPMSGLNFTARWNGFLWYEKCRKSSKNVNWAQIPSKSSFARFINLWRASLYIPSTSKLWRALKTRTMSKQLEFGLQS